ncbi:MAG: 4Fe-4S binding protein [Candidatus Njordarchaeales archaeon]
MKEFENKHQTLIIRKDRRLLKHAIRAISRWFLCLGCKLCELVCPTNAIKVVKNSKGYRPSIDSSKCIGCLLCNNLCPVGTFYAKAIMDEQK